MKSPETSAAQLGKIEESEEEVLADKIEAVVIVHPAEEDDDEEDEMLSQVKRDSHLTESNVSRMTSDVQSLYFCFICQIFILSWSFHFFLTQLVMIIKFFWRNVSSGVCLVV